ncbi:copper amine oxidase N-terminal domain-containing protein [Paenibacillus jiagnxiensis]|uniref:copper amine oxidase N-terminal domain-containing protein n=1 Tax=Paenibacillus jiagnxiensis TaxID=3228926 RepID=UPI0033AD756F
MKILKVSCLSVLGFALGLGSVQADASSIKVVVNNTTTLSDEAYISNGATMVPLKTVQTLPGITITWDNKTKTVKMIRDGQKITLKVGQKDATIGSKKVTLPVASTLKNGRVMVPLRFISDSSGAYVSWNSKSQTAYVAKASEELQKKYSSNNIAASRGAAIDLPQISNLKEFIPEGVENLNTNFYFPEGKFDSFFITEMDVISYYKINNDRRELVWTARFNPNVEDHSGLFFLPYKIIEQDGKMPSIQGRVAHFDFMAAIAEFRYEMIESNGQSTELGQKPVDPRNYFIEIPEERI